ncbi:MAG: SMI1/KNR4 family protein [Clostridia bacterium]|nr:SMI1/KNR4 family protein [Clostridia bacterium]
MLITDDIINSFEDEELRFQILRLSRYGAYCELTRNNTMNFYDLMLNVKGVDAIHDFYKVFDGGHIFDTDIFKSLGSGVGLFNLMVDDDDDEDEDDESFTVTDADDDDFRERFGIPENYVCFAKSSTGNFYCVDKKKFTTSIYEWDVELGEVIEVWTNFAQWLKNEIDLAEIDIEDGNLRPR